MTGISHILGESEHMVLIQSQAPARLSGAFALERRAMIGGDYYAGAFGRADSSAIGAARMDEWIGG